MWFASYWLRGDALRYAVDQIWGVPWSKFMVEAAVFQTMRTFRLAKSGTSAGFHGLERKLSGLNDLSEGLAGSITHEVEGLMRRMSGVANYWPSRWASTDEIRGWSLVECSLLAVVDAGRVPENFDDILGAVRMPVKPTELAGRDLQMSAEQLRDVLLAERLGEIGLAVR